MQFIRLTPQTVVKTVSEYFPLADFTVA